MTLQRIFKPDSSFTADSGCFLQHFNSICNESNAIPRLRQFILDLAIRGQLVQRDLNDEPSSKLIKQIQLEKARLLKKGKNKKREQLSPEDKEEEPFLIPTHWEWTRLGQIADWGSGSTPLRDNQDFFDGGITWLKSGELNDNQQLSGSEETITELAISKCSFRKNKPGDVLIAMYGATIGKVAILAEPAVTNQAVCGCTPFAGIYNRYLFYFLLSQRARFHSASEGGAQPNISKIKITGFAFPLPPFAEQHRIVAKLDELMVLCDQIEKAKSEQESLRFSLTIASLQRLSHPNTEEDAQAFCKHVQFCLHNLSRLTTRPDQIRQLRQTIFDLAIRGKLVLQDSSDETTSTVEISTLKESLYKKDVGPHKIPDLWKWCRLGSISTLITDGEHITPPRIHERQVPLVTAKNVRNGFMDFSCTDWVSFETANKAWRRCRPANGDILLVCVGATTGRLCVLSEDKDMVLVRSVALIRPNLAINVEYLALALRSPTCQRQIWEKVKKTAQPCLYINRINSLLIPLPPLAEQRRIMAKVDELMLLCNELDKHITLSANRRSQLLETILHSV